MQGTLLGTVREAKTCPSDWPQEAYKPSGEDKTWLEITSKQNKKGEVLKEQ